MSTTHDGGPAFPVHTYDFQPSTGQQVVRHTDYGLSKREEFAKAALIGLLCNSYDGFYSDFPKLAEDAFKIADAMLKESQK
jgi:hypothetical protein